MPPTRVRAPLAMRITRMDRQKFNEAVADGFYPCAPSAVRGSARLFDEDDLVALFYFARLTEMGVAPRLAGHLACQVREHLSGTADKPRDLSEPRVSHVRSISGMGSTFSGYDPDHVQKKKHYPASGPIALSIEFNIVVVRAFIQAQIEEERSILGDEED